MNLYYFSIFQYHNIDATNINNINVHLSVIVSLRVPPPLGYDVTNLDVILLLFVSLALSCLTLPLSNLATASLFLYNFGRFCKIRKLAGSHDFMTHSPKNRINISIFMRIEISRIFPNSFAVAWGNSGSHDLSSITEYRLICTEELYIT